MISSLSAMASPKGKQAPVSIASLTDEEAIFKAVRNKCIQSPFTVLPLALAGGMLLLTASFGFGFVGVFLSIILGIIGAAAFVYNMWIRGEDLTREHIRWMMEQLKKERHSTLSEISKMCEDIGFSEGAKEANELSTAYSQYTSFLETRAGAKLGSAVSQRLALAESAREAGIAHLRQAAEIQMALAAVDIGKLRREHGEWTDKLSDSKANKSVLETHIAAHARQIERFDEMALRRDQLLASSNELEAALMNAFMSEAGRTELSLDKSSDNPATRLFNVVAAAEAAESDLKQYLGEIQRETESSS
jgi:hypothetical protein